MTERLARAGISGLPEVAALAESAARDAGLPAPKVTSDAKHVEIGLTDKSDSARAVLRELRRDGIAAELVLFAGDEFGPLGGMRGSDSLMLVAEAARSTAFSVGVEPTGVPPGVVSLPGGPPRFLAVLDDQLRRRRDVPRVAAEPGWSLAVEGYDRETEPAVDALLTTGDGMIGTSGAPLSGHPDARAEVLASGVYHGDGPATDLLRAPTWATLDRPLSPDDRLRRVLDLRTGLLAEHVEGASPVDAVRFVARAEHVGVLRVTGDLAAEPPPFAAGERVEGSDGSIALAAHQEVDATGLERIVAYDLAGRPRIAGTGARPRGSRARTRLRASSASPPARVGPALGRRRREHRRRRRVAAARARRAVPPHERGRRRRRERGRRARPHRARVPRSRLLGRRSLRPPVPRRDPPRIRAVDARVPDPAAAGRVGQSPRRGSSRGSVRVGVGRVRRRRDADGRPRPERAHGAHPHRPRRGAHRGRRRVGRRLLRGLVGRRRVHAGSGRELLVETARYWASRIHLDHDGVAHLYGVIGPDEYHEPVDDNAFTNVLARWNLRTAAAWAAAPGSDVTAEERQRWSTLAAALVDGFDEARGVYEQFAGFDRLEPLRIADVAPRRPITADLLLGPERVAAAQVVKQADVLMLHHLLADEVAPGSLAANLDFYEPRTAHGSSLSPGIHASLFARAGRMEPALELLRIAAAIDVEDLSKTTSGGVHLAAMGSVWQALAFGFAGMHPLGGTLRLDPHLPPAWPTLELNVQHRGVGVGVRIEPRIGDGARRRARRARAGRTAGFLSRWDGPRFPSTPREGNHERHPRCDRQLGGGATRARLRATSSPP